MNIKIQSIHFDADVKLEEFITTKVSKLKQYHESIMGAEVFLRLDKSQAAENKIAEIKLDVPGSDFFAKKQSSSFEAATDGAVEALRRQLKRFVEKQRGE